MVLGKSKDVLSGESSNRWVFTAWKQPHIRLELVEYMIYQKELCPITQREHYQGYIEFKNSYKLFQVKSLFKDKAMFVEIATKPRINNLVYCSKSSSSLGDRFMYSSKVDTQTYEIEDVFDL